jgi:hypothetical protein
MTSTHVMHYYFLLHLGGYDVYTRRGIITSYYFSVVMTSTHVMQIQYHTFKHTSCNYYFLIHLSGYDVYTRHAIITSYYISAVMMSTHVMQLQYHTFRHASCNYYFLVYLSGYDVYTRHAITISQFQTHVMELLLFTHRSTRILQLTGRLQYDRVM